LVFPPFHAPQKKSGASNDRDAAKATGVYAGEYYNKFDYGQ